MVKDISKIVLVFFLVPNLCFAECPKPVQFLKIEEKANCNGYLFSPEKELEVRITNEDNKLLKKEIEFKDLKIDKLNKSLFETDKIIDLERQKSELWRARAEDSTMKLVESEDGRGKRDFWMVVLGVALTVGAGFAIGQAAK